MRFLLLLVFWPLALGAQDLSGHGGPVRALAVLGDGLASAGFDQAVILWHPASGRARRVIRWHEGAVHALATLPDGRLASAGEDGRVAVWGAGDAPERVLEGHAGPVTALLALPGGRLASAAWDGTVRVWTLATGAGRVLEGHAGHVNALAWAGVLHSAGQDGTIRRWGEDGVSAVIAELGWPQVALVALPDDSLASGGVDGRVVLIAPAGAQVELAAGPRPVVALAVSPDGGTLAVGSIGGAVGLHALPGGRLRATLEGPGLPVWSLAFAADGRSLWSGGQDRRVRRWDAATARALGPLAPAAEEAEGEGLGAQVWRACRACHALRPDDGPMAGPHLHGIFGRRMGSLPGYRYSERLARGDITWTPETVADLFTRGPDVVTPGTRMPVQRVGNAEELAALIRFLEAETR